MAWTPVQHREDVGLLNDPESLAFSGNVTNGNLIVVFYTYGDNTGAAPTFSQSAGTATTSSWTTMPNNVRESVNGQGIAGGWALVTGTGSCTVHASSGQGLAGSSQQAISEWSGNAAASVGDVSQGHVTTGTSPASSSITPNENGALVIAAAMDDTAGAGSITGPGTGWSELAASGGANLMEVQYIVQSVAAGISATWANSANEASINMIMAFKPPSGATRGLFLHDLMHGDGVGGSFFRNPLAAPAGFARRDRIYVPARMAA